MDFHLTPYIVMVVAGFVSFIAALAYGRFATNSDDNKPQG